VTCKRSRGVSGKALLWPVGVWSCSLGDGLVSERGSNRPSPGRSDDPHLPEPASGGNGWFGFRSCLVSSLSLSGIRVQFNRNIFARRNSRQHCGLENDADLFGVNYSPVGGCEAGGSPSFSSAMGRTEFEFCHGGGLGLCFR